MAVAQVSRLRGREDIALELKMPLATVRSYLQRAVKTLRAKADRTLKEYSRG